LTDLDFAPVRKGPPRLSDAVERIGQHPNAHHMRDPYDIGEVLCQLALTGEPVTVYFPQHGMAMARIEHVDTDHDTFAIDMDGDVPSQCGKPVFVAALGNNAKLEFELDQEWRGLPNASHLVMSPFPATCRVLNRRAEQRLELPVGGNHSARFTVSQTRFEFPLCDFSINGVGFRGSPEQAKSLHVGRQLKNVELELGSSQIVIADLEIRLLRPFRTFLLGRQVQVGCRIADMSAQMRANLDLAVQAARSRIR
jgi:c-di-GMP-binding flagellar brake protein YcgR